MAAEGDNNFQRDHKSEHEEPCEKRAGLRDELLFKQPESSHLGDCPICMLPLLLDVSKTVIKTCCRKLICKGCHYASYLRAAQASLNHPSCPLCRHVICKSEKEEEQRMKRVGENDPVAMYYHGMKQYKEGDYMGAFEWYAKAAELGFAEAHNKLSIMLYWDGEGVEKDEGKAIYHLEKASIGGHPSARHNLGCVEWRNGNTERAVKHWIIAAKQGEDYSVKRLVEEFRNGLVSKEDLATTLRAHQAASDLAKSLQREEADDYFFMEAEGNNIRTYIYMGEEGEEIPIPYDGTQIIVIVHEDVTVILANAFYGDSRIIEVICHDGVEKIEEEAFSECSSLRRVIMPGVEIVEWCAFYKCDALRDVECGKLKMIGEGAFDDCISLGSINLPSARIVKEGAFRECIALTDVKFSSKLGRIDFRAFANCCSLERITIPLRDGLIAGDNDVFMGCERLEHVDLVEGALHETIAALFLEDWRNVMNKRIDSINQILPNADAGEVECDEPGEKARVIRRWIRSLLRKIIHYQAEHRRVVNEAGSTLYHALPDDIVMNNALPFLKLPSHTFFKEDDEDEDIDSDDGDDMEE